MKNIKTIVLVALVSIMFAGCGSKADASSPKEITEKVFKATLEFDFETLKQYVAKNRLSTLEKDERRFAKNIELRDELTKDVKDAKVKVLSEEFSEDGQSAIVTVQIKLMTEEEPYEGELNFIKENGEWKMDENPF